MQDLNLPVVYVVGYSSGVDASLFFAELRMEWNFKTHLVMIGPANDFKAFDPSGKELREIEFINRVIVLANFGDKILFIDDTPNS